MGSLKENPPLECLFVLKLIPDLKWDSDIGSIIKHTGKIVDS